MMKAICLALLAFASLTATAKPLAWVLPEQEGGEIEWRNAQGEAVYPHDWLKTQPALQQQWQQTVARVAPKAPMHNWLRNMGGVATPISTVNLRGKAYAQFWVCQPRNCAGNKVSVLIDLQGKRQALYAFHVYEVSDPKQPGYHVSHTETRMYGYPIDFELAHLKAMHSAETANQP